MSSKSDSCTAKARPGAVSADTHKHRPVGRFASNPVERVASNPVGRFAPSPSGPLHFGSLVTALASFLDVRCQNGEWLLRIDDLDAPRTTAGSESAILRALEAHRLHWDRTPTRQSDHQPHYELALEKLAGQEQLFFCNCSRKSLKEAVTYPGTCRSKRCTTATLATHLRIPTGEHHSAVRLQMPDCELQFDDQLQGQQCTHLSDEGGDYIVLRRDGLVSYQLAVVVDDTLTGVTQVVRGADLLATTARQQHLHQQLGYTAPSWLHLPVLLNQRHKKLSKQAHSMAVTTEHAATNLTTALQLLGQQPPLDAHRWPLEELLDWAVAHWSRSQLPAQAAFERFYSW